MPIAPAWHRHFNDKSEKVETHAHGDVFDAGHDHPELNLGPVES